MSRTTLDIDAAVLRELRRRGQREGKSMGQVASEVLAQALAAEEPAQAQKFEWLSRSLGRPLIDIEDKEALRAILDKRA